VHFTPSLKQFTPEIQLPRYVALNSTRENKNVCMGRSLRSCSASSKFFADYGAVRICIMYLTPKARPSEANKMNFKLTAAALGAALLVSAVVSCNEDPSNNDATLLGLTALALQPVIQGSPEARTAAAAAMNAANAAAQGASAPANFALNSMNPKQMLAVARNRIIARQLSGRPQAMPTALSCADGLCDFTGDELVTGDFLCPAGGTAMANGVTMRRSSVFPNIDIRNNGNFTFNACGQLGMDYGRLPAVGIRTFTLSGDLTLNHVTTATISGDATTVNGVSNTQGALQSSALIVDGASYAMDLTIVSQDNSFGDYSQAQSADPRITFVVSGNVDINGTVNGETVVVKTPYSGTVVCRTGNGTLVCQ
jgi:hypothetical protein